EGFLEQCLGGAVVWRDGRFEVADALFSGDPSDQGHQHAQSQTLAAHRGVYRDLPDEQRVGASGRTVTGNETYQLAICIFGRDGGVSEIRALQKVAIHRIDIQRLATGYQVVEGRTVAVGWATERYGRNT